MMDPHGSAGPADLHNLQIGALRQAVDIYMRGAYSDGQPPEVVRRRLEWDPGLDADSLLCHPPFERAGKSRSNNTAIYALRLGNSAYPHMKLQVQPWPNQAGFMLSVNTHDQVLSLDPDAEDMPAFRAIQKENQRLKEEIEEAWDRAGLPTFLRYLREYIQSRTADAPPPPQPPDDAG
jgi:hypothetical protein